MKPKKKKLPKRLYVVRHARSLANEKLEEAQAAGAEVFELPMPEHLAPIVELGHEQVFDLATWMAQLPAEERPTRMVSSTHERTRQTSDGLVKHGGLALEVIHDERFIEKKWGVIGGLTRQGYHIRFPEEAARRARQGDFRYRPAKGGESLRDVKKRVKPALEEHLEAHADETLAIVTHSQVILVLRQLIEKLSEREALELDETRKIPNCSICVYVRKGNRLVLEKEYFVAPKAP